jgi:NADH-quinone oxidoreductase subunit C
LRASNRRGLPEDAGIVTEAAPSLANQVSGLFGDLLKPLPAVAGDTAFEVVAHELLAVATRLRDEPALRFEILIDVAGVDFLGYGDTEWKAENATATGFSRGVHRGGPMLLPESRPRFAVSYQLLSIAHNRRLRLRTFCANADDPVVDSLCGVWASANWFEREVYDLFGIQFRGHPDLRRILTDYGFIGHPFRKDFPLIGNVEVRYDETQKRVIYEPVAIEPRTLVPRVIRHDNRYDPALLGPDTK